MAQEANPDLHQHSSRCPLMQSCLGLSAGVSLKSFNMRLKTTVTITNLTNDTGY
ncbi:mCG147658 [Mus musculus]|nr:mCG147658 [Mus musculus]